MPIPGLTDTYAFADWMKAEYVKAGRPVMTVRPESGGLLTVLFTSTHHDKDHTDTVEVKFSANPPLEKCRRSRFQHCENDQCERREALDRAIAIAEEMP